MGDLKKNPPDVLMIDDREDLHRILEEMLPRVTEEGRRTVPDAAASERAPQIWTAEVGNFNTVLVAGREIDIPVNMGRGFDHIPEEFWESTGEKQQTPKISLPPGHRLLAFAEFWFSRKLFDEVLQPTINDMRTEYNEALADGRVSKARWIRIRGTWGFLKAAGILKILELAKEAARIWKVIP